MRDTFRVTTAMRSDNPVKAAEAYIDAGLSLVITHGVDRDGNCTCGSDNCTSPGKHPIEKFFPHGVKDATTEKSKIRKALQYCPNANIAVALGGRTVVDIDGPDGRALLDSLNLPKTATVKTSRGIHLHFLGELPGGSSKARQVDLLTSASRYAMLPPSIHESGFEYRWDPDAPHRAAPVPVSLGDIRRSSKRTIDFAAGKIRKGERNDRLFKASCGLRMRGISEAAILDAVRAINKRDCTEPLPDHEIRKLVSSSVRYGDDERLFGPPEQRTPLPMEFLWYPYIPRHAVTIIAGDPGRGKSLLTALLIGTVTSGSNWPLSDERSSGKRVLLLSAEDNWARVTLHRLEKAGFVIDNLHVMHKFRSLSDERLQKLAEHVRVWKPDLIVIDTLAAYMGGARDMHRQNEVGEFLGFLNEIAEESGCAVVALGHLNKQTTEHPMFRIVGSIGFAASIRSALFLGTDPADRTRLALAHGKASGSPQGQTVIFQRIGGGRNEVPILKAVELSDADAVDVCRIERASVGRPSNESDAAREFILDFLDEEEPKKWTSLVRSAEAKSIASAATLAAVRADLAKAGHIVQHGRARNAMWLRTPVDEEDRE